MNINNIISVLFLFTLLSCNSKNHKEKIHIYKHKISHSYINPLPLYGTYNNNDDNDAEMFIYYYVVYYNGDSYSYISSNYVTNLESVNWVKDPINTQYPKNEEESDKELEVDEKNIEEDITDAEDNTTEANNEIDNNNENNDGSESSGSDDGGSSSDGGGSDGGGGE